MTTTAGDNVGPGDASLFTVDVEEYFQAHAFEDRVDRDDWDAMPARIERSVDELLEHLDGAGVEATFFVLGWVAERHPEMVRRIAAAGHEMASHGWWHRRVPETSPGEFRAEVRRTRRVLEELTGRRVLGYRAPSFSLGPDQRWALRILAEEGYLYDSSHLPVRRRGPSAPDSPRGPHRVEGEGWELLEVPVSTEHWILERGPAAGGAYFRHYPYAVTRRVLRGASGRGHPGVFYLHPWELDPGQPRIRSSWLVRLRHYRGLEGTGEKLDRLLREFRFTSVARHFGLAPGDDEDAGEKVSV